MRFVLPIVAGCAQVALAIWGAFVGLHKSWSERRKGTVLGISFLLAIIGVTATIIQAMWSSQKLDKYNSDLNDALQRLQVETSKSSKLISLNTDLQRKLVDQSDQVIRLSRDAISTTTGGKSFCYMAFRHHSGNVHTPVFIHVGQHSLYGVVVRLVDLDDLSRDVWPGFLLGDLTVNGSADGPLLRTNLTKPIRLNVFFQARNGWWTELLRCMPSGEPCSITVFRKDGRDNRPVFKRIQPGFSGVPE